MWVSIHNLNQHDLSLSWVIRLERQKQWDFGRWIFDWFGGVGQLLIEPLVISKTNSESDFTTFRKPVPRGLAGRWEKVWRLAWPCVALRKRECLGTQVIPSCITSERLRGKRQIRTTCACRHKLRRGAGPSSVEWPFG